MGHASKYVGLSASCLLSVAACSTTPVQPEPTYELVDSFEYDLELGVWAFLESPGTTVFEQEIDEEGPDVPLANTALQQDSAGTFATAFGSVEPFELTAGTTVDTGGRANVSVDADAELEMDLERCGYPAGTAVRVVATLAPATAAIPLGDFSGSEGEGVFELVVDVRVSHGGPDWRTRGRVYAEVSEDTSFGWEWTQEFTPTAGEVDFFEAFVGLDATVDSPELAVGPDGCIDVRARLEAGGSVYSPVDVALRVSGSYSLSIIIEVVS